MDGKMLVTYKVLCESDVNSEIKLSELLANEKIAKVIKSEYAKGFRNIELTSKESSSPIVLQTQKELHSFEVEKNDYADLLDLAEEDATSKKSFKKGCSRIELVDIETLPV